jgi:hypothetical protein
LSPLCAVHAATQLTHRRQAAVTQSLQGQKRVARGLIVEDDQAVRDRNGVFGRNVHAPKPATDLLPFDARSRDCDCFNLQRAEG